ncbi:MAG: hypothetical protein IPN95_13835 [Bacteroidetes bacterium]|nr:hypothetical protein [Bacteroidota bacterium]
MQYLLFEDQSFFDLWPLTFTRPTCDLRVGIDKLQEKWTRFCKQPVGCIAYAYLGNQFSRFDPYARKYLLQWQIHPGCELDQGFG